MGRSSFWSRPLARERWLDHAFVHLLDSGLVRHPQIGAGTSRWLGEVAFPFWEGIAARARSHGIAVTSAYNEGQEWGDPDFAEVELLNPHTASGVGTAQRAQMRREAKHGRKACRFIARLAPPPEHPELDWPSVAAALPLLRRGETASSPPHPVLYPPAGEGDPFLPGGPEALWEEIGRWVDAWCAAVVASAQGEGLLLRGSFCLEGELSGGPLTVQAVMKVREPATNLTLEAAADLRSRCAR